MTFLFEVIVMVQVADTARFPTTLLGHLWGS